MENKIYSRVRGNHWNFPVEILDTDGSPLDCTNYESRMVIKRRLISSEPLIMDTFIDWVDKIQVSVFINFSLLTLKKLIQNMYLENVIYLL